MKVEDVMTKAVASCAVNDTLNDAARVMWERDCGIVPVLAGGTDRHVLGVVTDRDVCMAAYTKGRSLEQIRVGEIMSNRVSYCRAQDEVKTAEQIMQQAQVHRLPVLDDGDGLLGVISLADIARASARRSRGGQAAVTPLEIGETLAAIRKPRQLTASVAT
jgi:CBS domain-containing protein